LTLNLVHMLFRPTLIYPKQKILQKIIGLYISQTFWFSREPKLCARRILKKKTKIL